MTTLRYNAKTIISLVLGFCLLLSLTSAQADDAIGGGNKGNTRGNGVLDEVVLFDVVLREADLQLIMKRGVAALPAPSPDRGR